MAGSSTDSRATTAINVLLNELMGLQGTKADKKVDMAAIKKMNAKKK